MEKTYNVILSYLAELDLNEIIEYYIHVNENYVEKIILQFEEKISNLTYFPEIGRVVPELEKQNILHYREIIEGNYRIIYEIQENKVIVHTIIDARRNFEELIIRKLLR
jgi:toxin ParE1/3/4